MNIFCHNTSLIWLSNVCKDNINHTDQKSVILRLTSIMNYGNNIRSFFCHIYKISSNSMREFNSINNSFNTHNIRNMRNSCT